MFSVPLKCGNCRNLVDFEFWHIVDHTKRSPEEMTQVGELPSGRRIGLTVTTLRDEDIVTGSAHTHCPRCGQPTLILYECTRTAHKGIKTVIAEREGQLFGGSSVVNVTQYFPTPPKADQSPFWPESLRKIFADCQDMLVEGKSPSIILATTRSVLELALKELNADPKPTLFNRIELLHQQGVITSPIKDWAHDIRLDGNAGTHGGNGDAAAAAEYVEFLKLFLDMSFSLPERIKQKRQEAATV